ncbi:MAG: tripartite tricarboxylate transporter substrate binding protein [Betaproteobacteria bacterium]|nr:tripartite tricarboxylate transporter substrate binding protein [Betaproteobacteria bacterium]
MNRIRKHVATRHGAKPLGLHWLATFAALALCASWTRPAFAQSPINYPDRPIRLIVPFPAGAVTDIVGRLTAQKLSPRLGQQVLVENRAGASGSIGVEYVAKAPPDGTTMGLITASTHGLATALGAKLPYDAIKDFKPVSMIGEAPYVLVIYPGIAAKTVSDLIALAKTKPGQINYGSAGIASVGHLAAALFAHQSGIALNHVPYKATVQSAIDIMAGRLDMQVATVAPILQNMREGKLRALATTGGKRISALPEVPTMIEAGVKDYVVALWMALAMPAATPEPLTRRLNAEMTAILSESDTGETLRRQGLEPETGAPELVTSRIRGEIDMWRALIVRTGIKAE